MDGECLKQFTGQFLPSLEQEGSWNNNPEVKYPLAKGKYTCSSPLQKASQTFEHLASSCRGISRPPDIPPTFISLLGKRGSGQH